MIYVLRPNPHKQSVFRYDAVLEKASDTNREVTVTETRTRAPGTKKTICANPSVSLGGMLNTGLLDEVENPYADESSYKSPEWKALLKGVKTIKRQHVLEYKHNAPINYYTNRIDLSGYPVKAESIPFFQTAAAQWNINDGTTVIDVSKPRDELLYYLARVNSEIASSFEELTHEHSFYLETLEDRGKTETEGKKKLNASISKLEEIAEEPGLCVSFCRVVGGSPSRVRSLNDNQAYNELDAFIRQNDDCRKQFNRVHKLFNDDPIDFYARVKLWELQDARLVVNDGNKYIWKNARDAEGQAMEPITWNRLSDVINFLKSPEFQPEQDILDKQLAAINRLT